MKITLLNSVSLRPCFSRTFAILGCLLIVCTGCVTTGKYSGPSSSRYDCSSMAGVFFNLGRNSKDPKKNYPPQNYRAFLVATLTDSDHISSDMREEPEISVAIKHVGSGRVKYALLDASGNILETGTQQNYDACSRGVLKRVRRDELKLSDGWLGPEPKLTSTLLINTEGKLLISTKEFAAGLFLGFPIISDSVFWEEFSPNPQLDVHDIEF